MELKRENYCPLLKKECIGIKCDWFVKVTGYDINSGKNVDEWDCTISSLPKTLLQSSGMQRQVTSAFNSFKQEINKFNEEASAMFNNVKDNK